MNFEILILIVAALAVAALAGYASSARASVLVLLEEIIRLRAALKDAKKRLRGAGMLGSDEML
jgi:sigma54-dependent transcription regulator